MKIVVEEENLLEIENRNLLGFIVAVIFIISGIVLLIKPGEKQTKLVGAFAFLFGLIAILLWQYIKIIFDKTQGKLLILKKGVFGKKEEIYNFSDIKEVAFQEWETYDINQGDSSTPVTRTTNHRLALITNEEKEIIINSGGKGNNFAILPGMKKSSKEGMIAEKIANFLNVPLKKGNREVTGIVN